MGNFFSHLWQKAKRIKPACTGLMLASLIFPMVPNVSLAASGDRTLYLYYTHTKETAKITFRRNGRYDSKGLSQLNTFLRDWRRNEPTKMDPALFDLIWEVYQEAGASKPIHVVSAYRSPKTNEMLRSKSRAVAKNSRHTMGMAMDFYIPGVKISKLRQIAMSKQVGGVGYYPTSGSPFVHLDTGNVRAWPRMTRAQLKRVFPNGKTLHVPNDGKPLSQSGYAYAKAQWTKCHSVPCSGSNNARVRVASTNSSNKTPEKTAGNGKNLLDWFLGNEADDNEAAAPVVAATAPSRVAVKTTPPVPSAFPKSLRNTLEPNTLVAAPTIQVAALDADAATPTPLARPTWVGSTSAAGNSQQEPATAVLAVASLGSAPTPAPRKLFTPKPEVPAPIVTAYAPEIDTQPDAQRAVQMLIERRNKEPGSVTPNLNTKGLRLTTASTGGDTSGFASLFDNIEKAVVSSGLSLPTSRTNSAEIFAKKQLQRLSIQARTTQFVAPDIEHVMEIFMDPSAMSSNRYAVIFEHDEADFSPKTELGHHISQIGFVRGPLYTDKANRFGSIKPLSVASR